MRGVGMRSSERLASTGARQLQHRCKKDFLARARDGREPLARCCCLLPGVPTSTNVSRWMSVPSPRSVRAFQVSHKTMRTRGRPSHTTPLVLERESRRVLSSVVPPTGRLALATSPASFIGCDLRSFLLLCPPAVLSPLGAVSAATGGPQVRLRVC